MGLLQKAGALAKKENVQGLLHKAEEKAKDPELRAKVQGAAEALKEKTVDTVGVVKERAEAELHKHRGEKAVDNASAADTVTPLAAAETHDGRSASQRNEGDDIDPLAGPEEQLPD